jgi:hypothetical protein
LLNDESRITIIGPHRSHGGSELQAASCLVAVLASA